MLYLIPGQHIHFVGIGGFGMSAIARILLEQGFYISGSDLNSNELTEALKRDGAVIYHGHDPAYVANAEMVVASSAIPPDHIELLSAQAQGIEVYKRADIISAVMRGHKGIAIAGSHGKTTTTAMTTHILIHARQHPSYIIGGILANTGQNAGVGVGNLFVIEADEYDNMFHGLEPHVEVITNVEYDHPDFFQTPHELMASFRQFVGLLPQDGLLIACADDATTDIFANNRIIVNLPTITYGIANPLAQWRAVNLQFKTDKTHFDIVRQGEFLGSVQLQLPGRHNVLNAMAAIIATTSQGVSFDEAAQAISIFQGTGRRFDVRGERDGVIVVDDYAHHPTEIKATLAAARQRYPGHKIWAVWQPHTYTRIQQLFDGFTMAFGDADEVLVTDIYRARERPIVGVNSANIVKALKRTTARHTPSLDDTLDVLLEQVRGPAIILILSAGDAPLIGERYLERAKGAVG